MVSPSGSLLDPSLEQFALLGGDGLSSRFRRHDQIGIMAFDPTQDFALLWRAGHDGLFALADELRGFLFVEPQIRLAVGRVGSMAMEAMLGEYRSNLKPKVDRPRCAFGALLGLDGSKS